MGNCRYLTITKDTLIFDINGSEVTPVRAENLQPGLKVKEDHDGIILESDAAKTGAKAIIIIR